jgi:hypothetical protein
MRGAERGTALIEVMVIGFAVVAVVLPVLLAVLQLSEAEVRATTAATDVATWMARHGAVPPDDPAIDVQVAVGTDTVVVRARAPVRVFGVEFTTVEATVERLMEASVSPYRSDR